MADELRERKDIDTADKWDLSSLFTDDAAWEKGLQSIDPLIAEAAAFRGKLKDAGSIRQYFDAEQRLDMAMSDVFAYAFLRRSEDMRDSRAQDMYSRAYAKYVEESTAVSFAAPEILALPEEKLREIAEADVLAEYHYTLVKLLREKPHTLTAPEERVLSTLGEVLGAPKNIAENLQNADLTFDPVKDKDGKETEVAGSNYILLESSKDRVLREQAFRSFYRGYRKHINTFAAAYAGAVKGAVAEASLRHYSSSREMASLSEQVPPQVYDNLIDAVHRNMPLMYRYVALRKKILGVCALHYYDLYAPLSAAPEKRYTYDEAKALVLEAVRPLGGEYVSRVKQGFADRWVDVYPNRGKEGGAYSESTYRSNPFIMANFTGTLDSVSTIAHEMGHSMHSWLSNHAQKPQNADYTLFVAEVASTVNENLLAEDLLEKAAAPEEKMSILNQYLEGFKGTVYRQTMFAEFEKEAHEAAERGESLSAAKLSGIYRKLVAEYFGPELVIDDEVALEWARIPHFYRPFYVYKYATSYSAAVALSEGILADYRKGKTGVENAAAARYLRFLSLGGSMDPLEELAIAGVDFTTPEPVDRALRKFGRVLDMAEKLADELK
jgi:oligoendopeptidase F